MKIGEVKHKNKIAKDAYELDSLETLAFVMKLAAILNKGNMLELLTDNPSDFFMLASAYLQDRQYEFPGIDVYVTERLRDALHMSSALAAEGLLALQSDELHLSDDRGVEYLLKLRRDLSFTAFACSLVVKKRNFLEYAAPYFRLEPASAFVWTKFQCIPERHGYEINVNHILRAVDAHLKLDSENLPSAQEIAQKILETCALSVADDLGEASSISFDLISKDTVDPYSIRIKFDDMLLREADGAVLIADPIPLFYGKYPSPSFTCTIAKRAVFRGMLYTAIMAKPERLFAEATLVDIAELLTHTAP